MLSPLQPSHVGQLPSVNMVQVRLSLPCQRYHYQAGHTVVLQLEDFDGQGSNAHLDLLLDILKRKVLTQQSHLPACPDADTNQRVELIMESQVLFHPIRKPDHNANSIAAFSCLPSVNMVQVRSSLPEIPFQPGHTVVLVGTSRLEQQCSPGLTFVQKESVNVLTKVRNIQNTPYHNFVF